MFGDSEQPVISLHEFDFTDSLPLSDTVRLVSTFSELELRVFEAPFKLPLPVSTSFRDYDPINRFTDQKIMSYTFTLTKSERRNLQRFVYKNFLTRLQIVDGEGNLYTAFFINDEQNRLAANEFYPVDHLNVTLNFVGEKIGHAI
jgi:hypothetical protein